MLMLHSNIWPFLSFKPAFLADLEKMSSLEKITFLQEKLHDIRNHYLLLKSEVASIDRRRKRMKKKERESKFSIFQVYYEITEQNVNFN